MSAVEQQQILMFSNPLRLYMCRYGYYVFTCAVVAASIAKKTTTGYFCENNRNWIAVSILPCLFALV